MKISSVILPKNYPLSLKEIPSPPRQLFIIGDLSGGAISVSIVGTRKATPAGISLAKKIAKELAELGITIVSGLALGIDSAAHEGALEAKGLPAGRQGKTIAVLANGLDKIYPARNENLARRILDLGGALVSEYPDGTPSFPNQFLERNRIISGLSQATIVIEAPQKSGALATVRFALEQGREVFVVPGPVNHPNYIGSHQLIRNGARLVACAQDILEDLGIENTRQKQLDFSALNESQLKILNVLKQQTNPMEIDKLIEIVKLPSQEVNAQIASLVIQNIIKESGGNYFL